MTNETFKSCHVLIKTDKLRQTFIFVINNYKQTLNFKGYNPSSPNVQSLYCLHFSSAIKQGRYTHARKAQYTIEIKGGIGQADPEHVKVEPVPSISDEIDEDELNGTLQALVAIEEKFDPGFREQFQNLDFFHQKQKEVFVSV